MRGPPSAATLGLLLCGCMGLPEAEKLVLAEDELTELPALRAIPDAEPSSTAPAPVPEPPESPPTLRPRFVLAPQGSDSCWGFAAEGLPAISVDGTTIAVPDAKHIQINADPGHLSLLLRDVASDDITQTHAILEGASIVDDVEQGTCGQASREVRRRVAAANRVLDAGRWRTLELLPVSFASDDRTDEDREGYLASVPAAARIVEVGIRHGEVFVRIPGVQVLERAPASAATRGYPFAVYGDRESGTVLLVSLNCAGYSCTCDPRFTSQVLHWSPTTFAAIDERPCVADPDQRPSTRGQWGGCEPNDFDFDDDPWTFG